MDEDNDDQWLYGEETSTEKPSTNDETNDRSETDIFAEKEPEIFIEPPVSEEESNVRVSRVKYTFFCFH